MKELEISARTVEEATRQALEQLGVKRSQVEIDVLSEGKSGLLGIGAEEARIRVTLLENAGSQTVQTIARAQETLENILSYLELKASVIPQKENVMADSAEASGAPLVLDINGDDLGILIGRRGQTLACLQYIVRLIVTHQLGTAVPLVLDVNGYKRRRYESLRTLAQHVAEQVEVSRKSFALEPMPAYERRIIHLALAEHPHVTTESVGFGEARKVVVLPKAR